MGQVLDIGEDLTGINMSGNSAADRSLHSQQTAASEANSLQRSTYDQIRQDNEPFRTAGATALAGMQDKDFSRDFSAADFSADPGYAFRIAEGQKAIERSSAARGGRHGGATMKALNQFGQDSASAEYGNAYNRFNADRDRRYGRLSNLAGMGQNATSQMGSAGQNFANQYGQNLIGSANAEAAKNMGQASQFSGLVQSAATLGAGYMGAGKPSTAGAAGSAAGSGYQSPLTASMFATGGKGFVVSDERLKENITPVSRDEFAEMRKHLRAFRFNYKKDEHGSGEYVGVMAQDLEKSSLGRSLVVEDAKGNKKIDLLRVAMLWLATQAEAS